MIPRILHQSSKSFTWEERKLSKKAQALMPDWQHRFWSDRDNLLLVEEIIPRQVDDYLRLPAGVVRADIARYLYMYAYGGIYFDTDYRLFQALDGDLLSHLCILGVEDDDAPELGGGLKLGNAFIGSQPGLELWPEFIATVFTRFRNGEIPSDFVYLSGPQALTCFLRSRKHFGDMVTVLPREMVYPRLAKFNLTGVRNADTIGVHLCWSSWRYMSVPHQIKNRTRRILSALI